MEPRHLERHRHGMEGNRWIINFFVRLPMDEKDISEDIVKEVAEQKIFEWNARKKEGLEFINLVEIDKNHVKYEFNINNWIEYNFTDCEPKWVPPINLSFTYNKPIPHIIFVDGPWYDLQKAITDGFKHYLEGNKRQFTQKEGVKNVVSKIKSENITENEGLSKILNNTINKLFDFELDNTRSRILMKPNVTALSALFAISSNYNK